MSGVSQNAHAEPLLPLCDDCVKTSFYAVPVRRKSDFETLHFVMHGGVRCPAKHREFSRYLSVKQSQPVAGKVFTKIPTHHNLYHVAGAFITNTYDSNGRMTLTILKNSSGANLESALYTYNMGNQRIVVDRGSLGHVNEVDYGYDPLGQVISDTAVDLAMAAPSTNRLNEQLYYVFDPAGNLNYRTNNTLIQNFQVNSDNELTTATNGGRLTVMGTTTSAATNVTVNGSNALVYLDATFAATNMPLTTNYTAIAQDSYGRVATNIITVNLSTNVTFQYDANGNLTNDGLRSFAYDDENELIQVWVTSNWMSQFSYDGMMRRRIRQEFTWQGSTWVQTNAVYYVYDGNLVIQERDINNLPTTTYTRGKDLSGSLEGAGGIGGLLARTAQSYVDAPLAGHSFYHCDGNGNVTMLINSSQAVVAQYLYDAFGNVLSASGLLANANVYQFSSKERHLNSGLVYYLYRYYDPNLQRWPNKDPLGERRGHNLYEFIRNNSVIYADAFGLQEIILDPILEECPIRVLPPPEPTPTPTPPLPPPVPVLPPNPNPTPAPCPPPNPQPSPNCGGPPPPPPCTFDSEGPGPPGHEEDSKTCNYKCPGKDGTYSIQPAYFPKGTPCPQTNSFPAHPHF
jgi:RHS repeat-associated protein